MTFRARDNVGLDDDEFSLWLTSEGHVNSLTEAGPRRDYLSSNVTDESRDDFLENTLTRISGDDNDATYEWRFTLPTDLLPSIKQDLSLIHISEPTRPR